MSSSENLNPAQDQDSEILLRHDDGDFQPCEILILNSDQLTVRRHINWNTQRPDLKEDLAHLVQDIKQRICGIASAGFPSFSV